MPQVVAYGAQSSTDDVAKMYIERRNITDNDVSIDILYCGICHTDIHFARNDWGRSLYPVVPGHEIIGKISKVGGEVSKFKPGDIVGVGCMVDSCGHCQSCHDGLEQYCENGFTGTYSANDKKHGGITYGGYSHSMVVDQEFVLNIPANLDTHAVAPLLCAGITTYSPLREWDIKSGDKVGIVGLGGLGHMGVKIAHAMGAHVVMITSSPSKGKDAKQLGADEVLLSKDDIAMKEHMGSFDFLLNTIPVNHDLNPYIFLLKRDATMVIVGAIEAFKEGQLNGGNLIMQRKSLAGSLIGGIKETQEMLKFCGEHNVLPEVEMIKPNAINEAYERMLKHDIKYRFVIDFTQP